MSGLSRRHIILSGLGAGLAGCTPARLVSTLSSESAKAYGFGDFKPLDLSLENLTKITVCTRPFRAAGPRLETETVNGKTILHNYGHGGAGWSLAWGYAEEARDRVFANAPTSVSVLGAGAIGLTTAIAIAETGADVTIFAKDLPMESSSARATGVWSPSSRIGFASVVDDDFSTRWERYARRSYRRHLSYVGRAGHPVEFTPRFYVRSERREPPLVEPPAEGDDFLHLDRRTRDIVPRWIDRPGTPFANDAGVRGGLVMTFNIAEYMRQLSHDFQVLGGRIERAQINSLDDLSRLPGDMVVNCAGYAAKMLVDDRSLIPVRGQIAWMAPQTDRLYGVIHRNVMVLSRRDGLLVQEMGGNDHYGFGDDGMESDRDEFLAAQARVAPIFDWD